MRRRVAGVYSMRTLARMRGKMRGKSRAANRRDAARFVGGAIFFIGAGAFAARGTVVDVYRSLVFERTTAYVSGAHNERTGGNRATAWDADLVVTRQDGSVVRISQPVFIGFSGGSWSTRRGGELWAGAGLCIRVHPRRDVVVQCHEITPRASGIATIICLVPAVLFLWLVGALALAWPR